MSTTPFTPPPAPNDKPTWPGMMAHPTKVLDWLNKQRPLDNEGKKAVVTLRWLVFGELERTMPDISKSISDFTPEEPTASLPPLNEYRTGR